MRYYRYIQISIWPQAARIGVKLRQKWRRRCAGRVAQLLQARYTLTRLRRLVYKSGTAYLTLYLPTTQTRLTFSCTWPM